MQSLLNTFGVVLELTGAIVLALGASAFFSDRDTVESVKLRIPSSSTSGPPSASDYLNSFAGKEKRTARLLARIGTLMVVAGLSIELFTRVTSHCS